MHASLWRRSGRGILGALGLVAFTLSASPSAAILIENFESGSVVLESYPGQDGQPSAWELTSHQTWGGSAYALRLYGNTWKTEPVAPCPVDSATVWQVAVYVERRGEMQGFGVSDGTNELLYAISGSQLPQEPTWWTVYQGAFPAGVWVQYLLPIGRDWFATWGYYPEVTNLVYVNDDDAGVGGAIVFDEIRDVTAELPVAPRVAIEYTTGDVTRLAAGVFRVGVRFHAEVTDPDSPSHRFRWNFGDGATSAEEDPTHEFTVQSDHCYTVGVVVTDPDSLSGADTCQVAVDPGLYEGEVTVNFVGDIMTARGFESPGGIIEREGVESIFLPTRPILGDAADLSVGNLECSYTNRGTPHPTKTVVFRSRPENIAGVVSAGIDLVSIGNNHIIDYGQPGLDQTMSILDSVGVAYTGAGDDEYAALRPAYASVKGVRMAFLGQSNRTGREWNYQPFLDAGASKPGFASFIPHNLAAALGAGRDQADVVILQTHSGPEYDTMPPGGDGMSSADVIEPPVEANAIQPGDPDVRFLIEPTPGDRELRRQAIDAGADVVINHHPHVLQGFESYQGRLIAHSLGNFVFELYYPETMPTIVLTLEIEKSGIAGYRFTPAWIDDDVPHPATGRLGREIMDRMADYSRDMGALVAVDPGANAARIFLEPGSVEREVRVEELTTSLVLSHGAWISAPIALPGNGSLSRIVSIAGSGWSGGEVAWGREIVWHGGFEPDGATFWAPSGTDAYLDPTTAHGGTRSLALRRGPGTGSVSSDLERHIPADPLKRHGAVGWRKTEKAVNATLRADFFSSRYGTTPVGTAIVGAPMSGTSGWTAVWSELDTPANGIYCELRADMQASASDTARAWFDDLAFIEWEPWLDAASPRDVPAPNNMRFVQLRSATPVSGPVTIMIEEVTYGPIATAVRGGTRAEPRRFPILSASPNPFSPEVRLSLQAPAGPERLRATLAIYDVNGRRVATLFDGTLSGGSRRTLRWNGRDEEGHRVAGGVYFSRAEVGEREEVRKLILLR